MEDQKRWRLILGENDFSPKEISLDAESTEMDQLLNTIYDKKGPGFGKSSKKIRSWLEGIRSHFPGETVRILQQDALERVGAKEMLLEPELLQQIEPDIHLVAHILSFQNLLPDKTKAIARQWVQKLVKELEKKLRPKTTYAIQKNNRSASKRISPHNQNIDWKKTISKNLKHYQPSLGTLIPEHWYGFKKGNKLKEIFLLIDTSESMLESAINASILASILASLKTVRTHIIFFHDEVVDLTEKYSDPVDLLFSIPFGGGTDISKALHYTRQKMRKPDESYVFLISDLDEYGNKMNMLQNLNYFYTHHAKVFCILSLNDQGVGSYNKQMADQVAAIGIVCFSSTPDLFPDILAKELSDS